MIIDFHTHIFPEKIAARTLDFLKDICQTEPDTDGTAKDLIRSAKEAGVDLSVSLPAVTKPSQVDSINRFACEFQEGPILSFGGIHPECENYKEILKGIRDAGLKGIKLHPDYQDTYFNDIRYKRIVSCASELGLIVSVHAGLDPKCPEDIHCTPKMACWDEVEDLLAGENVYLDTAVVLGVVPEEQLVRIVRKHGADKILFGTDSPWAGQKEFVRYLSACSLSEQEKKMIFSENACRLLDIPVE